MVLMEVMMPDFDPSGPHWSLLTKTHKGLVSILRDLTLDQCRQAWERLDNYYGEVRYLPWPRPAPGHGWSSGGITWSGHDWDNRIEIREVFGPPGWDREAEMKHWQKWPRKATDEEQAGHDKLEETRQANTQKMLSKRPKRETWFG